MRKSTMLMWAWTGISLLTAAVAQAQAPPTAAGAGTGTGTGGAPARRYTSPYSSSGATRAPSGPRRYSPAAGGSVSGGISLPGGGGGGAPRRQLRRNTAPVLSPYLNLDPSFNNSFEGQFLMRTLPQEEFNRTQRQTQRAFEGVQGEIGDQQVQIQTGLSTTGHRTSFMNTGSYFPGNR